jgi:UPF0716 family protein affecting phage T7 exclusion
VSDALAVILMLPVTRHWLLRRTAAHFEAQVYRGTGVIHGEFTVVPEDGATADNDPAKDRPRIKDDRTIIDVE